MKKKRLAVMIIMLILVVIMGFSGYRIYEIQHEYNVGDRNYEQLQELAKSPADAPGAGANNGMAEDTVRNIEPVVEIPSMNIDFEALRGVNEDTIAWLYCPDTVIDYPVMRADDYAYYLRHLPDGTYNANGTLFLDYNCAPDFTDRISTIYGHHMQSGKMFASLAGYKKQEYYEEHPYLYLYTEEMNYRAEAVYGFVISAASWRDSGYMYPENAEALLEYASENTTFQSNLQTSEEDRYFALSTCSYEFSGARYVILCVLQPEYPGIEDAEASK